MGTMKTDRKPIYNNDNKKQLQAIPNSSMHGGYQTGKFQNFCVGQGQQLAGSVYVFIIPPRKRKEKTVVKMEINT